MVEKLTERGTWKNDEEIKNVTNSGLDHGGTTKRTECREVRIAIRHSNMISSKFPLKQNKTLSKIHKEQGSTC